MPTINFKLNDPRFCDKCPLIANNIEYDEGGMHPREECILGFWHCKLPLTVWMDKVTKKLMDVPNNRCWSFLGRPQACIDAYGE
jgi:hypothetical protein